MVEDSKVPKSAWQTIIVILVTLALLSVYAHVQKWRRPELETATVTLLPTATPSPTATP